MNELLTARDVDLVSNNLEMIERRTECSNRKAECTLEFGQLYANLLNANDLDQINEESIIKYLRHRYNANNVYSYFGKTLIALNPFHSIASLYAIQSYRLNSAKCERYPHVYTVAEEAVWLLKNDCENRAECQTIIVVGESGAGKTESIKRILTYLSNLHVDHANTRSTATKQQVSLDANLILEAFGNAATLKNENSSRFGKFLKLIYQHSNKYCQSLSWTKSVMETYLLETVRVVHQSAGERNFHIFYELLAGASAGLRIALYLEKYTAEDFSFVNRRTPLKRKDGIDDALSFKAVTFAMDSIGIDMDQQNSIWKLLAAILHLGNVSFTDQESEEQADKLCHVESKSMRHLDAACSLLGIDAAPMIMERSLVIAGELICVHNTLLQCIETRDSIARALYDFVFQSLVAKVNQACHVPEEADRDTSIFIGVLDIFGFEVFETNHFEQFCINYANERIQTLFLHDVIEEEQKIHVEEGIEWQRVCELNNVECVSLIENRPGGIICLLDEECIVPKGNDAAFARKLYNTHGANRCLHISRQDSAASVFCIKHYAGNVRYQVNGFCDKNKIKPDDDLFSLLAQSRDAKLAAIFLGKLQVREESDSAQTSSKMRRRSSIVGNGGVASNFRQQLKSLLTTITKTNRHYIRCIKPNSYNQSNVYDTIKVRDQLRNGGIIQAIQISHQSYAVRLSHRQFIDAYSILCCKSLFAEKYNEAELIDRMIAMTRDLFHFANQFKSRLKTPADKHVQLGKTRVFMKQYFFAFLQQQRQFKLRHSVRRIQKYWKNVLHNRKRKIICSATVLQKWWKQKLRINRLRKAVVRHSSAKIIQRSLLRLHFIRKSSHTETSSSTMEMEMTNQRDSASSPMYWSDNDEDRMDSSGHMYEEYQEQMRMWQGRALAAEAKLESLCAQSDALHRKVQKSNHVEISKDCANGLDTGTLYNDTKRYIDERCLYKLAENLTSHAAPKILTKQDPSTGFTMLHMAVQSGSPDVLGLFFRPDVFSFLDIHAADVNGDTALHWATRSTDLAVSCHMIQLLLCMGAKLNIVNCFGQSPLHFVSTCRPNDSVGVFKKLEIMLQHDFVPNQRDCRQRTALHYAAENQFTKVCALLVQNGWDLNAKDVDGFRVMSLPIAVKLLPFISEAPSPIPYTDIELCFICSKPFGIPRWRYHCSRCARICCSQCAPSIFLTDRFCIDCRFYERHKCL